MWAPSAWCSRRRRRRETVSRRRPGGRAFAISAAAHAVLLGPLVVFARPPEPMEFETIRVNLVMQPPSDVVEAAPDPTPAPPQPEPEPARVEPEPEVKVEEKPPEPEPKPQEIEKPKTEKPPETPAERPEPKRTEDAPVTGAGGDEMNLSTEGREFPFPDYIENVIVQVRRYFRWDGDSRPKGVVYFEILPDGSVRNIRMARPSGNRLFDISVEGAVETAGNRGAFGPLPDAYAGTTLPVQIEVEPPR